jgi:acetylornithine/succinyldiaminopimelate/putrescine aminotransferase
MRAHGDSTASAAGKPAANWVTADDVLSGRMDDAALGLELNHGNADLIRVLAHAGIAGPFKVVDPWHLADADGIVRINAGGYSALPLGDRYPPLTQFVARFLAEDASMGLPQQSASRWRAALEGNLVSLLARYAPSHADSQVFFSNSGAEAIEGAIKFARAARPKARHFINFTGAYHGKTLGALALTPNASYQDGFRPLALDAITLPFGDLDRLEQEIARVGPDRIVAICVEPIQGEAGVIVPPAGFLRGLDGLAKRHGILTIADEIQTGLGRSGYWFASIEWGGMDPDILTLAKGLGGGLVPVAATIARRPIYRAMLGGERSKRHSNTFGGNALAMAVGLKSIDLIAHEGLVERSRLLGGRGLARLQVIAAGHPRIIAGVRGFGMLMALQFQPVLSFPARLGRRPRVGELTGLTALMMLHRAGVQANFSLNAARVLRLTPALTMPEPVFEDMLACIERAAAEHRGAWRMLTRTPWKRLGAIGRFGLTGR